MITELHLTAFTQADGFRRSENPPFATFDAGLYPLFHRPLLLLLRATHLLFVAEYDCRPLPGLSVFGPHILQLRVVVLD
jgi:hypothetical protein